MIEELREAAGMAGLPLAVVTFARHPRQLFNDACDPFLLTSEAEKLQLLGFKFAGLFVLYNLITRCHIVVVTLLAFTVKSADKYQFYLLSVVFHNVFLLCRSSALNKIFAFGFSRYSLTSSLYFRSDGGGNTSFNNCITSAIVNFAVLAR